MPPYQLKKPPRADAIAGGIAHAVPQIMQFYLAHKRNQAYQKHIDDLKARGESADKLARDKFDFEAGGRDPQAPSKTYRPKPATSAPDATSMGGVPDAPVTEKVDEGPAQLPPQDPFQFTLNRDGAPLTPDNTASEQMGGMSNMPAYAQGTPLVPRTGPAMLHQGEEVIPADENPNNPGVEAAQAMEPPPRADVLAAKPQTLAMQGPTGGAEATLAGGGPLQQAEEFPDKADPATISKYRQMGQQAKARDNFMLQLKEEMAGYKGLESSLAQHVYQARHLKQQLDIAKNADPEKVPGIEAKLLEMQGTQQYYEKQLADFRQNVLGLAMDENGQITDKDLHAGLTHWLDKGTTRGERAVLEQNFTHKPRGFRAAPGGGSGIPRARRQSDLVSPAILGSRQG
jgi:hypothetical protein